MNIFLGDNGRTYDYIVKYGEDLRQDERIQQVFEICNELLSNSNSRDFRPLRTYPVVPFSGKLGIIGFVSQTTTYKSLATSPKLKTTLSKYSKIGYLVKTVNDFSKAVVQKEKSGDAFRLYVDQELEGCNDLVDSFKRLSSGPEGFFYLRRNFVISHAQLSVLTW